jgi:response regulator of citrate/malate metabolism
MLRIAIAAVTAACFSALALAQDIPGIEICTAEKTMERRTSCLQSNVDFLIKTIRKQALDHQQSVEATNRQIDALKAHVASLQKRLDDLQAAKDKESKPKEPAAK